MEPLQLSFPSSHKGPVLQGYLLPLGRAGSCFLSIYVCFLGGRLGSGKEKQLLQCRTEQLSLMQELRVLPLLFSHLPPLGAWLAERRLCGCRSLSCLYDAICIPGEPVATFQRGLV